MGRRQQCTRWCICTKCELRRDGGSGSIGSILATTAIGIAQAVTVTGVGDFQPGHGGTFDGNWADTSVQAETDRRSADMERGTNDKGNRSGWSGQQD